MAELLCLTSETIVFRCLSETLPSLTYNKCHYFSVRALGLGTQNITMCIQTYNQKKTFLLLNLLWNLGGKLYTKLETEMIFLQFLYFCEDGWKYLRIQIEWSVYYSKMFNVPSVMVLIKLVYFTKKLELFFLFQGYKASRHLYKFVRCWFCCSFH